MIVAVSDLHLGDKASNKEGFRKFVERYLKPKQDEITEFILMGDILDLWKHGLSESLSEHRDILRTIRSLDFKTIYIPGNHDMIILDYGSMKTKLNISDEIAAILEDLTIRQSHQVSNGKMKFRFIHGHQMNYWYALPFYETFSRAMCQIPEIQWDRMNVWQLLANEAKRLSPQSIDKIKGLTEGTRSKIMNRLAGPLEGNGKSIEDSMMEDLHLLQEFIDIRYVSNQEKQDEIIDTIRKEIFAVATQNLTSFQSKSWNDFLNSVDRNPLNEIATEFLKVWRDTLQWKKTNIIEGTDSDNVLPIGILRRFATTLLGLLHHDELLVHGHSHIPYVDHQLRIADPGCWIGEKSSFVSIEDGKIACNYWPH